MGAAATACATPPRIQPNSPSNRNKEQAEGKTIKKLTVYLDTSVINFLFAEDVPDFRRVTEEFFNYPPRGAVCCCEPEPQILEDPENRIPFGG